MKNFALNYFSKFNYKKYAFQKTSIFCKFWPPLGRNLGSNFTSHKSNEAANVEDVYFVNFLHLKNIHILNTLWYVTINLIHHLENLKKNVSASGVNNFKTKKVGFKNLKNFIKTVFFSFFQLINSTFSLFQISNTYLQKDKQKLLLLKIYLLIVCCSIWFY